MLPSGDQLRIREEEMLRFEIRRELAGAEKKAASKPTSWWGFLNSTFGVWLLTSVVVGGASFSYRLFSTAIDRSRQNSDAIQRLDTEIAGRLQEWYQLGDLAAVRNAFDNARFVEYYQLLVTAPERQKSENEIPGVFTEYGQRSLMSLLAELHVRVSDAERSDIARVSQALVAWRTKSADETSFTNKRSQLGQLFILSRWIGTNTIVQGSSGLNDSGRRSR
jgi:hypothetical protein